MTLLDNIISCKLSYAVTPKLVKKRNYNYMRILHHLLYDQERRKEDGWPLLYSCWDAFVEKKKLISIDMNDLHDFIFGRINAQILELIFSGRFKTEFYGQGSIDYAIMDDTNLLRKEFLDVFKNVTAIQINKFNALSAERYWPFSLSKFLNLLDNKKLTTIGIHAKPQNGQWETCSTKEAGSTSWIAALWNESSESIVKEYNDKGFDIKCDINPYGNSIYIKKRQ